MQRPLAFFLPAFLGLVVTTACRRVIALLVRHLLFHGRDASTAPEFRFASLRLRSARHDSRATEDGPHYFLNRLELDSQAKLNLARHTQGVSPRLEIGTEWHDTGPSYATDSIGRQSLVRSAR